MANGDGGVALKAMKLLFGDVPMQWVRLILLGAFLTWLGFAMRDFKNEVKNEALAVRGTLTEYIAANGAWQSLTKQERAVLLRKANARFKRLYQHNGWDYEDIEP